MSSGWERQGWLRSEGKENVTACPMERVDLCTSSPCPSLVAMVFSVLRYDQTPIHFPGHVIPSM